MSNRQRLFMGLIVLDLIILITLLFFSISYAELGNIDENNSGFINAPTNSINDDTSLYKNSDLDVTIKFEKSVNLSEVNVTKKENILNIKNFVDSYEMEINSNYVDLIEWIKLPCNIDENELIITKYENESANIINDFNIVDNYIYIYDYANIFIFLSKENETTTSKNNVTSTTKKTTTSKNNVSSTTKKTTTSKNNVSSTTKKTTAIKESTKITENQIIEKQENLYYFEWTKDEDIDYSGRNCLFIYKKDGTRVSGEVELIYYDKYIKIQKINDDDNNCFLEDKKTVKVNAIIVNGEKYEKINKE